MSAGPNEISDAGLKTFTYSDSGVSGPRIEILGDLRLNRREGNLPAGSYPQMVLGLFSVHKTYTRQELVDVLWPGEDLLDSEKLNRTRTNRNLDQALSLARKALADGRKTKGLLTSVNGIVHRDHNYDTTVESDVEDFYRYAGQTDAASWREALKLVRGDLGSGLHAPNAREEWIQDARKTFHATIDDLLVRLNLADPDTETARALVLSGQADRLVSAVPTTSEAPPGAPASHRRSSLELPPPPCVIVGGSASEKPGDLSEAVSGWFASDSNLAVVGGRFGAGKTTEIRTLAAQAQTDGKKVAFVDFDQLAAPPAMTGSTQAALGAGADLLIVDNFDSMSSLAASQGPPPDLRHIAQDLKAGTRCVIATRRPLDIAHDDLTGQLLSPARHDQLGVREPRLIEVMPYSTDLLSELESKNDSPAFGDVVHFLKTLGDEFGHLRRPLFIKMLVAIAGRPGDWASRETPPSPMDIYREYTSVALSRDYDAGRSRLSHALKRRVLTDIAWDVFTGAGTRYAATRGATISYSRMSERVLEHVMADRSLRDETDGRPHQWTLDFLNTNHLLSEIRTNEPPGLEAYRHCAFDHPSYLEYAVAEAIVMRTKAGEPLGLEPEHISQDLFHSQALAFVREAHDESLLAALRDLATSDRTSWPDRLLYLYLLEDEHDFLDLLAASPSSYRDDLESALQTPEAFFVWKMIAYQLVGFDLLSPYAYVDAVRDHEDEIAVAAERRHQGGGAGATKHLLRRLRSPGLAKAIPITVYRLGQMADQSAIPHLASLAASRDDARLTELCEEATRGILARHAER